MGRCGLLRADRERAQGSRSIELDPPLPSGWEPILVESLADNVGAKMNAVVERGAARDFLDVRELATRGIVTVEE